MTKKKQIILYSILFFLFLCTIVAISYAFYSFVSENNTTITAQVDMPACVSLSYSSGTKITISGANAVPISDGKALSATTYRYAFTVTNNCSRSTSASIVLSASSSSNMPMGALKYVVVGQSATTPSTGSYLPSPITLTSQVQSEILSQTGDTVTTGYNLTSISLSSNETKSYYLYLWIAEDEGGLGDNITTNKTLSAHLSIVGETSAADRIAALAGFTGEDGSGNEWGVVDDHGIRYVGQNPSNWVWFNCSDLNNQNAETCERWRIIGVFNEKYDTDGDNIPDTEGQLVKIIRNDTLGNYSWDYKRSGVGSSTNSFGSNDWSDSQLMMMLNPTTFVNSGYVNETDTTAVHSNTISGEYVVSGGINIFKNMGSYFYSSKTAYKPYDTNTYGYGYDSSGSSLTESTSNVLVDTTTFKRMNQASQPMIATVKWYLTGPNGDNYHDASNGLVSHWYNYERNINNAGYVYTEAGTRPKIWYGKVGLMYMSDYGFSTSGNSGVSGYDRASCLNKELYYWYDEDYRANCANNSWLGYNNTTASSVGTFPAIQWTINPVPETEYCVGVIYNREDRRSAIECVNANLNVSGGGAARPALYLEPIVTITGGEGTFDLPYSLSLGN